MIPHPNPLLAEPNPFLAAPESSPTPAGAAISSVPRIRRGVAFGTDGRYKRRYAHEPKDFRDRKAALTARLDSLYGTISGTALTHESLVPHTLDLTQYPTVPKAQLVVDWLNCPPLRPPMKGASDRVEKPGPGRPQYAEMLRLAREKLVVKVHRERGALEAEALSEGLQKMSV